MIEGRTRQGRAMTQEQAALPRFRLLLAWAAFLWERLWPAFWPVTAAAGIFLAIALFDLLPLLPGWLHAGVLAAFAFGVACKRGFAAFAPPGRAAAGVFKEARAAVGGRFPVTGRSPAMIGACHRWPIFDGRSLVMGGR